VKMLQGICAFLQNISSTLNTLKIGPHYFAKVLLHVLKPVNKPTNIQVAKE